MKFLLINAFLLILFSCSQKEVRNVDNEAEKVRDKIKKDKDYCSPVDKTLNTKGCE